MQKVTTAAQMRNMDRIAMHGIYAIAPAVLMENAGHAVAERAGAWLEGWDGKDVVLFCGKGNNGGDGFVMFKDDALLKDCVMIDNQVLINYIVDELGGVVSADYSDPKGQGLLSVA